MAGKTGNAAAAAAQAEENARLLAVQQAEELEAENDEVARAEEEDMREAELAAAAAARIAQLEAELAAARELAQTAALPIEPGGSDMMQFFARQQQETAQAFTDALGKISELVVGRNEVQVKLEGSARDLAAQLVGTVTDGGDGDEPLDQPVTFISRGRGLVVIKKQRHRGVGPTGEQYFTDGIAADFSPNAMFSTRNPEMVAYLKGRPGFGTEYWLMGAEPSAAVDPSPVLDKIFELVLALDDKALEELEEQERRVLARPAVLQALVSARRRVQSFGQGVA